MNSSERSTWESETPVLRCSDLHKTYGSRPVVKGISFEIAPGEAYGLLGPNGAGKTTVISIVCGLIYPEAGSVELCGKNLTRRDRQLRKLIGYVPQEIALYPELSARANLEFFGRLYGLRHRQLGERVQEALTTVGLFDRANDKVANYSGGMKRRLNIAAALLHRPRLLVLDEPTVGIDPQSRVSILDTVSDLRDQGTSVLYTTHYIEEASRLCDRIGIVDAGTLIAQGTERDLLEHLDGSRSVTLQGKGDLDRLAAVVKSWPDVECVHVSNDAIDVSCSSTADIVASLVSTAVNTKVQVHGVEVREPNLEHIFMSLTGKELRD
ncbi:MAG: ABC transporter ATP-binding protein [Acidimicrobiales bacterium]